MEQAATKNNKTQESGVDKRKTEKEKSLKEENEKKNQQDTKTKTKKKRKETYSRELDMRWARRQADLKIYQDT